MVQTGQVKHYEVTSCPQYAREGDAAAQNGNIEVNWPTSFTDGQAIDFWMEAPFHAMGMMDPRLTQSGYGAYRATGYGPWAAGFALDVIRGNSFTGGTYPVFCPGNAQSVPLPTYAGGERPIPPSRRP